jgi:hypothetical protein
VNIIPTGFNSVNSPADYHHHVESENRMENDEEADVQRRAVRVEPDWNVKRTFFGNKERARQLGGRTAIVYSTKDGTNVRVL